MILTDILTIIAILLGPIIAVQLTRIIDRNKRADERKLGIFKALMTTRSATLASQHIEALNMVDVEFDIKKPLEKDVVETWKVYLDHLNDRSYPKESWGARRVELMIDLLYKMGRALGFVFDKSHIKNTSYYPSGYGEMEDDQYIIRKSFVALLKGDTPLPVKIVNVPPPPSGN